MMFSNIRTDLNFILVNFCGQKTNFKWQSYQAESIRPPVANNYNLASDNYKAEYINVSVILIRVLIISSIRG